MITLEPWSRAGPLGASAAGQSMRVHALLAIPDQAGRRARTKGTISFENVPSFFSLKIF